MRCALKIMQQKREERQNKKDQPTLIHISLQNTQKAHHVAHFICVFEVAAARRRKTSR